MTFESGSRSRGAAPARQLQVQGRRLSSLGPANRGATRNRRVEHPALQLGYMLTPAYMGALIATVLVGSSAR